ncbi:hypothetical protein Tco_0640942, partial [Tanacetum coccineum]
SEANDESEPAEQRPERHESLTIHDAEVTRLRDKIASRRSSEFPLAPIISPPGIHRRSSTLI